MGSNKQAAVALSTTEADYMAACLTAKEIVWLKNLLNEISVQQQSPTDLLCDCQIAIRLVLNPEYHKRTKHIDVQPHFVREKQADGSIDMQYISTEQQLADLFTKPLHGPRFEKLRQEFGIVLFLALRHILYVRTSQKFVNVGCLFQRIN